MNILITGASRGIGLAITRQYAASRNKCCFFLVAQNHSRLAKVSDALSREFPIHRFFYFSCNVAALHEIQHCWQQIHEIEQHIDVLVNNAGYYTPGCISSEPENSMQEMLNVNFLSAYHFTRLVLPAMQNRRKGHIVNIVSIAGLQAYHNGGAYSVSKFAMLGFGKNLREEMKPFGIKVTNVIPGAVFTDSWQGSDVSPQRIMEPLDVAIMVEASTRLSPMACVEEIIMRPVLGDL